MKSLGVFLTLCLALHDNVSRGDFSTVINVPPQTSPTSIGSNTQLNLSSGGSMPADFDAGAANGSSANVEVNIAGGTVGVRFEAHAGATVNVSGGNIGLRFRTNDGSVANITGGVFGRDVTCEGGSVVNILGGDFNFEVHAFRHSTLNVWGGDISFFQTHDGAQANFFASEFSLDGVEMAGLVPGQTVIIHERDVPFSGILADGTPFDFDLISEHPDQTGADADHFGHDALLTVTIVSTADFDLDFDVDEFDLATWAASYGMNAAADTDRDGDTDGADFLAWQRQFTGAFGELTGATVVPEPSALGLLVVGNLLVLAGRRREGVKHLDRPA